MLITFYWESELGRPVLTYTTDFPAIPRREDTISFDGDASFNVGIIWTWSPTGVTIEAYLSHTRMPEEALDKSSDKSKHAWEIYCRDANRVYNRLMALGWQED